MVSLSEIENAFFNHAADAGVIFTDRLLIADGVLHRVHIDGDKRGTKNGAYILHADGNPAGWFQHFNTGVSGKWTLSGKREPMTKAMLEQIKADRERRQIEQQERHNDAADKARYIWSQSTPATTEHPYLTKKRVKPHGLRIGRGNTLIVPIFDESKILVNLQFISETGGKRFLSGGKKKGCFSVVGRSDGISPILICEGVSTGFSLFENTGNFTVVALDAGNLEPVALVIRKLYPPAEIVICADHDPVGIKAAKAAALAVGGKYILPAIAGLDWNDALNMEVPL